MENVFSVPKYKIVFDVTMCRASNVFQAFIILTDNATNAHNNARIVLKKIIVQNAIHLYHPNIIIMKAFASLAI
jgi:hypothetical protein